jgi:hypothetical protein
MRGWKWDGSAQRPRRVTLSEKEAAKSCRRAMRSEALNYRRFKPSDPLASLESLRFAMRYRDEALRLEHPAIEVKAQLSLL